LSLREQQHDSIISRQASQTISEETVADEISKPAGAESYPPRLQKIIELLKEKGSAALGEGHLRELEGSEIKLSAETDGENLDNSSRSSENYQPAEEQDDNRTDSLEKNQDSLSKPADKPDKDSTFLKLPFFNWKKPDRKRRPLSIEELVLLSGEPLPPEERRQCPNPGCGAVISKSATTCPWCGHSL
jgi:hypothetical protein